MNEHPMPNPGRADKASGWWPFKKKISQPIFAIVDAINNGEFTLSISNGVLKFAHKEHDLTLEFWGGRMFHSDWCSQDEVELLCKTAYNYKREHDKYLMDNVRQSFMKFIKEN